MPDVIIISTGDELLYGTTINTNSSFISGLFFGSNFNVIKHIVIGDDINSIITCVNDSLKESDIIITTGGLGPTDDDKTVEAVSRIFEKNIVNDEESRIRTEEYFRSMKYTPNSLDIKMSSVPEGAIVIKNRTGLAPGFILKSGNKTVISLPGVPAEAETMMRQDVIPYLKSEFSLSEEMKLTYRLSGIRETDINTLVNGIDLPEKLRIGITAKSGICGLTVTGSIHEAEIKNSIDKKIRHTFSKFLIMNDFESPEEELIYLLKSKGLSISTAESCTGGLIAKRITDVAGSSAVYMGSVIAYSNEIKISHLGVDENTIRLYGAVSEKTAAEMAEGIQKKFKTDVSVSTTGIAGPGGGSEEKPVGTVCFGFKIRDYQYTETRIIKGNRERVRTFSGLYAVNFLREYLKNLS